MLFSCLTGCLRWQIHQLLYCDKQGSLVYNLFRLAVASFLLPSTQLLSQCLLFYIYIISAPHFCYQFLRFSEYELSWYNRHFPKTVALKIEAHCLLTFSLIFLLFLPERVFWKNFIPSPRVSPFLSHRTLLMPLDAKCLEVFPQQAILWDTTWVSYSLSQF